MSSEKFNKFFNKHSNTFFALLMLAIAIPLGYAVALELVRVENLEIKSLSYKEVKMMAEMQPEMIPLINEALTDGKISRREYNDLRRKRFEMLDNLEIEKNKNDLITYLNK